MEISSGWLKRAITERSMPWSIDIERELCN